MGGSSRSGRVVLRSYNNANSQGGVAYANANNDSSNTILDKTREAGEIPFRTVIRRKTFGEGKKKYCFT